MVLLVLRREHQAVDVEPVVADGLGLGRVHVHAQVAQRGVALDLGPQDQASPRVEGFGRRLLVVAVVAHADAGSP